MDDAALIARVLAGETDAFATLVERHQRMIFALASTHLRSHDLADEVTQDTFVAAFEGLAGFRRASSFKTWLTAIALNECRAAARRLRKHRSIDLDDAPESALAADATADDPTARARLGALVGQLPPRQRKVVSLRVYDDLPFKEIARVEGISENSAKVNFHHGIGRLRQWLRGTAR